MGPFSFKPSFFFKDLCLCSFRQNLASGWCILGKTCWEFDERLLILQYSSVLIREAALSSGWKLTPKLTACQSIESKCLWKNQLYMGHLYHPTPRCREPLRRWSGKTVTARDYGGLLSTNGFTDSTDSQDLWEDCSGQMDSRTGPIASVGVPLRTNGLRDSVSLWEDCLGWMDSHLWIQMDSRTHSVWGCLHRSSQPAFQPGGGRKDSWAPTPSRGVIDSWWLLGSFL